MPAGERVEMLKAERMLKSLGIYLGPPGVYGYCPPPGEPCGHVSCRHHLGIHVDDDTGALTIMHPVPDTDPSRRHLLDGLSPRDREIKIRGDRGESNADIGAAVGLPARAVKRIRYRMSAKFNVDPELDVTAMDETCSLRVADSGAQSQERVADLMGIDQPTVSTLEASALRKMRRAMRQDGGPGI
jgi:DNA-binding CsgD family transcriptional regulator